MNAPSLVAAFGAGLLSFLSPCILPLIPGYISFISGYGLSEIREGGARGRVLSRTLAFVLGFSLVFVLLGLFFSGGGMALGASGGPGLGPSAAGGLPLSRILSIGAGIIVALLGLNLIFDVVKILNLEARFHPGKKPAGLGGAFVLGLAFAAGWSPCVGPILASILFLAARDGNLAQAAALLGLYSAGLALPFMAAGLFFDRLTPLMAWFKRRARGVRIVSGLLLVGLGAVMALGRLSAVSSMAANAGFALRAAAEACPGASAAIAGSAWLTAAALVAGYAIAKKRRLLAPARVAILAALVALAALEFSGAVSTAKTLAAWLLFQGG